MSYLIQNHIKTIVSFTISILMTGLLLVTVYAAGPIAVDDTVKTNQDTSVVINPLENDSDADTDPLSIITIGTPLSGTVTISGTSQLVYTPNLGFRGTDVFTYGVSDGGTATAATIRVGVAMDAQIAATNIGLSGDDSATPNNLPFGFDFTFFGTTYTQIGMSTNGLLMFECGGGNCSSQYSNPSIPTTDISHFIGPFWDDLVMQCPSGLYQTIGQAPSRIFIAQWSDMFSFGTGDKLGTIQALLYEDSQEIQFQYPILQGTAEAFGSSATVGLNAYPQGVQYSYNTPSLSQTQPIRFIPGSGTYTYTTDAEYVPLSLIDTTWPGIPQLISPTHQITDTPRYTNFSWSASIPAADQYLLRVATDENFATVVVNQVTSQTSHTALLNHGTTYYWQVLAQQSNGCGSVYSSIQQFTVVPNQPPQAQNDGTTTHNKDTVEIDVLVNDSDPDLLNMAKGSTYNSLAIHAVGPALQGSVGIDLINALVVYTPTLGYVGTDSFTYTVSDGELTDEAMVTVTVIEADNSEPVTPLADTSIIVSETGQNNTITTTIQVPANAITQVTTIVFSDTASSNPTPGAYEFAGSIFTLDAYIGESLQADFSFAQPVTLTMHYNDGDLSGLDEATLMLYYWNGTAWASNGVALIDIDVDSNIAIFTITHLTEFALMALPPSLSINKTAVGIDNAVTNLPSGSVLTYTINLNNAGNGTATNVLMTDVLPMGVSFGGWVQQNGAEYRDNSSSVMLPEGGTMALPSGSVMWGQSDIAGSTQEQVIFTATVASDVAYQGQSITNTATFTSTNAGKGESNAAFRIVNTIYHIYLPLYSSTPN